MRNSIFKCFSKGYLDMNSKEKLNPKLILVASKDRLGMAMEGT
jgi:hypothetical protein